MAVRSGTIPRILALSRLCPGEGNYERDTVENGVATICGMAPKVPA